MSKQPKKQEKTFNAEPLQGEQVISKDGSHISVSGRTFRRTILPSIAVQHHRQSNEIAESLDELDSKTFQEQDGE